MMMNFWRHQLLNIYFTNIQKQNITDPMRIINLYHVLILSDAPSIINPLLPLIYSNLKKKVMDPELVQQLFENAQFILLLKDQVEVMVGDSIVKRNETRSSFDMVDEINSTIGRIIEINIREEMTNVTGSIFQSLMRVKQEAEKSIETMLEDMKEQAERFQKRIEETVRDMKKDMMSNSIRIDHRISTMSRTSSNQMSNKLKDITNQLTVPISFKDQNLPKSLKLLPFSSKALPELDSTCSDELKTRLKQLEKTIQEIESVLMDIENRLHQRYEVNIASLWTVVAEIEGKLLTEQKVESKLVDLRGSMLLANEAKEEGVGDKSKKWFKF